MPATTRRSYLASLGAATVGGLAGCAPLGDRSPPAGSLRFDNDHTLPHAIRLEVTGVGADPGEGAGGVTGEVIAPPTQRNLTASTVVEPGETATYESVFTEDAWYGVQFWVDGDIPDDNAGMTRFNPAAADGGTWEFLTGHVYASGDFSWGVSSTDDAGDFDR